MMLMVPDMVLNELVSFVGFVNVNFPSHIQSSKNLCDFLQLIGPSTHSVSACKITCYFILPISAPLF